MDAETARSEMTARLAQLLEREERIDAHLHERDREVPQDWPELAKYRENDEVVAELDDLTRQEVRSIQAALARIEQGTWGTCTACKASFRRPTRK